jgi:hypothetical protein
VKVSLIFSITFEMNLSIPMTEENKDPEKKKREYHLKTWE